MTPCSGNVGHRETGSSSRRPRLACPGHKLVPGASVEEEEKRLWLQEQMRAAEKAAAVRKRMVPLPACACLRSPSPLSSSSPPFTPFGFFSPPRCAFPGASSGSFARFGRGAAASFLVRARECATVPFLVPASPRDSAAPVGRDRVRLQRSR